ncbi:non-canonical purine NTP pyrophosphatase, partial [Glutamicibacter protophormiae]|uniref:non-canonical purine NTP pyrophosphatase n=1 Tax=Glutamicibacter protophormiae TaxID=37930 RepID=UPI00332099A4
MSAPVLVLASHNAGKLRELRELLRGKVPGLDVDTQVIDAATAGASDPVEDQVTFAGNALKKAREVAASSGLIALADDSGLSVDVLGGAPGIFSARWSGVHGNDEANIDLLLAQRGGGNDPEHRFVVDEQRDQRRPDRHAAHEV